MAKPMKTPGVYIVEKSAFPNSVVEVATAVPAFIGYTEKALNKDKSLTNVPRRITSMAEFRSYFGDAPPVRFTISSEDTDNAAIRARRFALAAADAALDAADAAANATATPPKQRGKSDAATAAAAAAHAARAAAQEASDAADVAQRASIEAGEPADTEPAADATPPEADGAPEDAGDGGNATSPEPAAPSAAADRDAAVARFVLAADTANGAAAALDSAPKATPELASAVVDATTALSEAAEELQRIEAAALKNAPADPAKLRAAAESAATIAKDAAGAAKTAAEAAKAAADAAAANSSDKATEASGAADAARTSAQTALADQRDDEPAVRVSNRAYYIDGASHSHVLYWAMRLFFQNGGGACYIVSVGDYSAAPAFAPLVAGINTLIKEPEPTMVVIPDAVRLGIDQCIDVQKQSMSHCREMQSRVSILDVPRGHEDRAVDPDCITEFRSKLGVNDLDYAAAYYPWVETTMVQDADVGVTTIDPASASVVEDLVMRDLGLDGDPQNDKEEQQTRLAKQIDGDHWKAEDRKTEADLANEALLHKSLVANSGAYKRLFDAIKVRMNLLPPSAAMAGVYTMVDNTRGVWKAPANVSLNGVIQPSVNISHDEQEDLNVNAQGKSINAIRTFVGEGTLVWGARTLDGNSLDWRYINVRRTLIMLEQSMKQAAKAYVFEANDANTWITMKSMARNFLTGIWRRGGLAGATPDDAFSVFVGLGETMTSEDILEGILRMTILVAPVRPAEFIEITFQQQMQKS